MEIGIRARGFGLTAGLRQRVLHRLRFAFAAIAHRVRGVDVCLADDNGPRGGTDKRCRVRVIVPGVPAVVIEDVEPDLYAAIDRALDRAGRTAARRLARGRDERRAAVAV